MSVSRKKSNPFKRLISINAEIRSNEKTISKNEEKIKRLTRLLDSLEEHGQQLAAKEPQLKAHIQGKVNLGVKGFKRMKRDIETLIVIAHQLQVHQRKTLGDFEEVGDIAKENEHLNAEIEKLVKEAETLVIDLIEKEEDFPGRINNIMSYISYRKMRRQLGR